MGWGCTVLSAALLLTEVAPAPPPGAVRVGLSLPTQREERWVRDREAMEAAARSAGVDLRVANAENDPVKQAAQCDRLVADGVKVLILAPQDSAAAASIVERASKAGVRVVSYDRLVTLSPHAYHYLSFDNELVGVLQAQHLAQRAPKGAYLLLTGAPTDHNAALFAFGARRVLQPLVDRGDVRIVLDQPVRDWRPDEAERLCAQALRANGGRLDAVLAPNDGTAGGCIRALEAAGLAGKVPVTGQDAELAAARRLVKGTQTMTVFKDTRALGRRAIEMALSLAKGEPVETRGRTVHNGKRAVPSVLLPPVAVTRENLDAVLVQSGYLTRAAVHGD